jgi:hypothetical protein
VATEYYHPLDPKCPVVVKFEFDFVNDEMTRAMGVPVDEFRKNFEHKHRIVCERCQRYGAANIEIRTVT